MGPRCLVVNFARAKISSTSSWISSSSTSWAGLLAAALLAAAALSVSDRKALG